MVELGHQLGIGPGIRCPSGDGGVAVCVGLGLVPAVADSRAGGVAVAVLPPVVFQVCPVLVLPVHWCGEVWCT